MTKAIELAKECEFWEPLGLPSDWDEGDMVVSQQQLETFYARAQEQVLREAADAIYKGMPPNRAREMLRRMADELEGT